MISFDRVTVIWVMKGRSALSPGVSDASSSKIPANTGTMNATTAVITITANVKTSAGYMSAARICRRRASSFSS